MVDPDRLNGMHIRSHRAIIIVSHFAHKERFSVVCCAWDLASGMATVSQITLGLLQNFKKVISRRDDALCFHVKIFAVVNKLVNTTPDLIQDYLQFFWVINVIKCAQYSMYMRKITLCI